MPYPQRDIRIRSFFGAEGDDALAALRLESAKQAELPAASTTNDAAEDLMRPEEPEEPDDIEADTPAKEKRATA